VGNLSEFLKDFYLPSASRQRLVLLLEGNCRLPLLLEGLPHLGKKCLAQKIASWWHGEERINHPDTISLQAEKGGAISVDMARSFSRFLNLTPYSSRLKVGLIFDAENLTPEAANALLKTLEEAREDVRIVLTTVDAKKLLPTLVSRCMRFALVPFSLVALKQIAEKEGWSVSQTMLELAAGRIGYLKKLMQDKELLQELLKDKTEASNLLRLDSTGERLLELKTHFEGRFDSLLLALENFLVSSSPDGKWASAWRDLEQTRRKINFLNMNPNLAITELLIKLPVFP